MEIDLKKSKEIVGPLYPILLDANGDPIDGFTRRGAAPDWPTRRLEKVKTEKGRILVRIAANHHRRNVSVKERAEDFLKLAEILGGEGVKEGKIAGEVARLTGFTDRYARMLLPEKYRRGYKVPETEITSKLRQCELEVLVGELVQSVSHERDPELKCGECPIAEPCAELKTKLGVLFKR